MMTCIVGVEKGRPTASANKAASNIAGKRALNYLNIVGVYSSARVTNNGEAYFTIGVM